jgi:hypothetical protein
LLLEKLDSGRIEDDTKTQDIMLFYKKSMGQAKNKIACQTTNAAAGLMNIKNLI